MQITYYKEYSRYMGRDMEFKVYGSGGVPMLALPCRGGRFYDWEDHGMTSAAAQFIDSGRLQVFCADSADGESFLAGGDARTRAEKAERWFCYLTLELYPRILELNGGKAGTVAAAGTDLGAAHALRLWLRRPELFCGVIALSGEYEAARFFGQAADDLTLRCGCAELVRSGVFRAPTAPQTAADETPAAAPVILCAGRGPWEDAALASTQAMAGLLQAAGADVQLEVWGDDVSHDWAWWQRQFSLFTARLLNAVH